MAYVYVFHFHAPTVQFQKARHFRAPKVLYSCKLLEIHTLCSMFGVVRFDLSPPFCYQSLK